MRIDQLKQKDEIYLKKNIFLGDSSVAYIPIGSPLHVVKRNFSGGSAPVSVILSSRLGVHLDLNSDQFDEYVSDFEENIARTGGTIDNA